MQAKRILIADDNRESAQTLAALVQHWGHHVLAVTGGKEAIKAAAEFKPDVAILDIDMPVIDGYAVARALRAALGPAIQLVALTGLPLALFQLTATQAGFDHCLSKPLQAADFSRLLGDPSPPPDTAGVAG